MDIINNKNAKRHTVRTLTDLHQVFLSTYCVPICQTDIIDTKDVMCYTHSLPSLSLCYCCCFSLSQAFQSSQSYTLAATLLQSSLFHSLHCGPSPDFFFFFPLSDNNHQVDYFCHYGACWVCVCCHNLPNSDIDYRTLKVCTDINVPVHQVWPKPFCKAQ